MLHARKDYDGIQDPNSTTTIGEDEPVFLLRAKDCAAPTAVRVWAEIVKFIGGDISLWRSAQQHAYRMEIWQSKHGRKVPDASQDNLR